MKAFHLVILFLLAAWTPALRAEPDAYVPGPDSVVQAGVPHGDLIAFDFSDSKIFPGTTRKVTVYVPKSYDPATPACVFVDQDGVQWNAPVVLDNLIARKELPIMIGVFVTPGVVTASLPASQLSRFNRSLEYDGLGDSYVRFLLEELLPVVETRATSDGRPVHLSHSGNDRAIAGSSSGAIAAFTAAWERPDAFTRVFSSIGTYIGLRGGERYPTLIRKYEPKPLRVFLQDGSNDLNIYAGDWWMANQTMERALEFSGYEVNHVWGDGGHTGKQAGSVLPDALRWLWKDWPKPVERGTSRNAALKALLIPGEDWKVVATGYAEAANAASNSLGEVIFSDPKTRVAYRIATDGAVATFAGVSAEVERFGPGQILYASRLDDSRIDSRNREGKEAIFATGLHPRDFVVAHNGTLYATDCQPNRGIWLVRQGGATQTVDTGIRLPTGITLSPDQSLLYVADGDSHWIYSYRILADGTLADKQRYYWLHESDQDEGSGALGMCCDRAGWLYVATRLGIQICDQAGRVNAILPSPGGRVSSLCFGGEHFDTLFATCGTAVYRRRLAATGANAWDGPTLPAAPRL